jgi:hypothetical protein
MQKKLTLISITAICILMLVGCCCKQPKVQAVAFTNPNRVIMPYHLAPKSPLLPIKNQHVYYPGCYVACYSHDKNNSVYQVSKNIYAVGAIRVAGHYEAGICQPVGFVHKNISTKTKFKNLCSNTFASCKGNKCWAGGDTAGLMNRG